MHRKIYIFSNIRKVIHACAHTYLCVYVCVCVFLCNHVLKYTYTYTYTHIYIYIYIYTYSHRDDYDEWFLATEAFRGRATLQDRSVYDGDGAEVFEVYSYIHRSMHIYIYIYIYIHVHTYLHINTLCVYI